MLLLFANSLAQTTDAQNTEQSWNDKLSNELGYIGYEYGYYAGTVDDKGILINPNFPADREEELLHYIETQYLTDKNYKEFYQISNPIISVSNVSFAKLLLSYGGNIFDKGTDTPNNDNVFNGLIYAITRGGFYKNVEKFTSHQGIIDRLGADRTSKVAWDIDWSNRVSDAHAIGLVKLFISLGAEADATSIRDSLVWDYSDWLYNDDIIFEHFNYEGDPVDPESLAVLLPRIKDRADDIQRPDIATNEEDDAGKSSIYYYRSPVTYWLEEFIEAGYPASMLDTHKLHYPRFMKTASVAEVTAMLNNPDAHKIPANINCPYKETCPLTPSVNMRDAMGRTPLHIAGEQGNKAVFNALIQTGADESVKDYRGNLAGL